MTLVRKCDRPLPMKMDYSISVFHVTLVIDAEVDSSILVALPWL